MVGNSGSGKSTLARALAVKLGVLYVELDAIFHQPDWTPLPEDEFRARVAAIVDRDRWVIDGNYRTIQPIVWQRADTVIWLDPPRWTVMRQIVWRTLRRAAGRVELWNGNRERWRNLFTLDPQKSVIAWAWTSHAKNRAGYRAAALDQANRHLTFIRLGSRAEVAALVEHAKKRTLD